MRAILDYPWPGNVRQLRALCERWLISHSGQSLEKEHLPRDMSGEAMTCATAGRDAPSWQERRGDNSERIQFMS